MPAGCAPGTHSIEEMWRVLCCTGSKVTGRCRHSSSSSILLSGSRSDGRRDACQRLTLSTGGFMDGDDVWGRHRTTQTDRGAYRRSALCTYTGSYSTVQNKEINGQRMLAMLFWRRWFQQRLFQERGCRKNVPSRSRLPRPRRMGMSKSSAFARLTVVQRLKLQRAATAVIITQPLDSIAVLQPTTLGAFLAARDSRHAGAAFNQNLYAPRPPTASRQARQDRQDWGRGRHLANDAWEISAAMARCGLDVGHARLISRDSQATASTGSDLRGLQCRLLLAAAAAAAAGVCRPRSRLRPWDALPGAGAGCCWSCSVGTEAGW